MKNEAIALTKQVKDEQRTANIGLAKAEQTEVIEHLYFSQHSCCILADAFQSPAFGNPQNVSGHWY